MEWRCEWCGKPHDEDDPPCDNCGHGTFERAVVQQPAEGPAGNSTTLWVCTECGREHTKHSPPCSRCGAAILERREQSVDDSELVAPGYLDLVTPRYVLGLAVALLLGTVLVLGLAGVVDLPGMDSEVPGSAETYQGISLATVEDEYVARFNEERAAAGQPELQRDEGMDEVVEAHNQQLVADLVDDRSPPEPDELRSALGETCRGDVTVAQLVLPASEAGSTAEEMGTALATARARDPGVDDPAPRGRTGVDVHAVDDQLVLTHATC